MTRDRSFLRRWSFFTGALLVLAEPARAKDLILFDGSSVAAVVYDANGDMPVAKIAQLLGHDLTALSGRAPAVTADFTAVKGPAVVIASWRRFRTRSKSGSSGTFAESSRTRWGTVHLPGAGAPGCSVRRIRETS